MSTRPLAQLRWTKAEIQKKWTLCLNINSWFPKIDEVHVFEKKTPERFSDESLNEKLRQPVLDNEFHLKKALLRKALILAVQL